MTEVEKKILEVAIESYKKGYDAALSEAIEKMRLERDHRHQNSTSIYWIKILESLKHTP
jgi:hypothetical protein